MCKNIYKNVYYIISHYQITLSIYNVIFLNKYINNYNHSCFFLSGKYAFYTVYIRYNMYNFFFHNDINYTKQS